MSTGTTGLAEVELLAAPQALADIAARLGVAAGEPLIAHDPWGTLIAIRAA